MSNQQNRAWWQPVQKTTEEWQEHLAAKLLRHKRFSDAHKRVEEKHKEYLKKLETDINKNTPVP